MASLTWIQRSNWWIEQNKISGDDFNTLYQRAITWKMSQKIDTDVLVENDDYQLLFGMKKSISIISLIASSRVLSLPPTEPQEMLLLCSFLNYALDYQTK